MRSAYGFQIPMEDAELTHVGPGTPGGELLRRYWHPVCLSADLTDLPKRVRLLGEDLVAFRDGRGRAGLFFYLCSHRATSLEYGRIEAEGLRCAYHGWLYDVGGNVLEMPLEPPGSSFKEKVKHPCYPVREFGGLVFAYMGPPERMPELPLYDVLLNQGGTLRARVGPRVGGAVNCNWLQSQENLMDILHTMWLHSQHSTPQFPSTHYGIMPRVEYEETEMGMRAVMTRALPDGREWDVIWEVIMPFTTFVLHTEEPGPGGAGAEKARAVHYCMPVDDTRQWSASIFWVPAGKEDELPDKGRMELSPLGRKDTSYEYTQRHPDDKEVMEGQWPIALHGLEHLATSDRGVIMFRRILRDAIGAVRAGRDPKGVIRDPRRAGCVPTSAGSILKVGRVPVSC